MNARVKVVLVCLSSCGLAAGLAAVSIPAGVATSGAGRTVHLAPVTHPARAQLESGTAPNIPVPDRGATTIGGFPAALSFNWSGYVASDATEQYFTGVSGHWTIPRIVCTSEEDQVVSVWVGIDGSNNETVEQTGTTSECYEQRAIYYSWWEMFPGPTMVVGTSVAPDDQISASVTRSGTAYTLQLTDPTSLGNNIDQTENCALATCKDTSAEFIVERPDYQAVGLTPLARFTIPVAFSAASVTGGSTTGPITDFDSFASDMVDATVRYLLAQPGNLNAAGKAFHVTWDDSW
ncbi:MAG: G1 family glutamic endopeptidase [Acidimicrobiales bacterium]